MVYNCVRPLSNHGCRQINWNWTQVKLNSSLWRTNDSGANLSHVSCWALVSKPNLTKSAWNLASNFSLKMSPSAHIYLLSVAHVITTSGICCVFAPALVSTHLNYCNSLLSGIADIDLTELQDVQKWLVRVVMKSPPFTRRFPLLHPLHWLKCRIELKICLLTYKSLHEKQLFIFTATSLQSDSLKITQRNRSVSF